MLTPIEINELEAYKNNKLPSAKKNALNEKLASNKDFKEEADIYFEIFDGFYALELETFENNLKTWEQKHKNSQKQETPKFGVWSFFRRYKIAAAVLLLLLPLGYVLQETFLVKRDHTTLFATNFNARDVEFYLYPSRGEGDRSKNKTEKQIREVKESKDVLKLGFAAYNEADYLHAISYFKKYLELDWSENKKEISFYLGVSYLAIKNTEEAKSLFHGLLQEKNTFEQDAQWYLALTLLSEDNIQAASRILSVIGKSNSGHKYQESAENMLLEMEKYNIK